MELVSDSPTYLHSAVSVLENGLAAPIIILLWGKNALDCLYFFKPTTIVLGGYKPTI